MGILLTYAKTAQFGLYVTQQYLSKIQGGPFKIIKPHVWQVIDINVTPCTWKLQGG